MDTPVSTSFESVTLTLTQLLEQESTAAVLLYPACSWSQQQLKSQSLTVLSYDPDTMMKSLNCRHVTPSE